MNISPLTLHDCEEWAKLLAVAFNRSHTEMVNILEHLHATFPVLAWGAWDGPVLAAQYSSLLTELHIPGELAPALVGVCVNMATHPQYRGQGLIKQVARPVYEELAARGGIAGVGFSNAAGVRVDRQSQSYGYHVIGQMQSWAAVLLRVPPVEPLQSAEQWPPTLTPLPACERIYFEPTPAWLNYRFAGHPQRTYRFAIWREAEQVCGAVAYRLLHGRRAALLSVYGTNPVELVIRWARMMQNSGIWLIHLLTTPGSLWVQVLRRIALVFPLPASRHPYYLTVKPLDDSTKLLDFASWDCLGGDIL